MRLLFFHQCWPRLTFSDPETTFFQTKIDLKWPDVTLAVLTKIIIRSIQTNRNKFRRRKWILNMDSRGTRMFTPMLSAGPFRGHTALKSIMWETLFLKQLYYFSLLSINVFLHPFLKSKLMKENFLTPKTSF